MTGQQPHWPRTSAVTILDHTTTGKHKIDVTALSIISPLLVAVSDSIDHQLLQICVLARGGLPFNRGIQDPDWHPDGLRILPKACTTTNLNKRLNISKS